MAELMLELRRDTDLDEHGHPSGFLWVKQVRNGTPGAGVTYFHTRERGHHYYRLPPGNYTMAHAVHGRFPDVQCLRPLGLPSVHLSNCLIHPITRHCIPMDDPKFLEGCIAPFLVGQAEVAFSSDRAMEQLWGVLGGWSLGKTVSLTILNDVPREAM